MIFCLDCTIFQMHFEEEISNIIYIYIFILLISDSPCSSDSPIFWIVPSILAVGFMMAFIYEFIKLQKIQKLAGA